MASMRQKKVESVQLEDLDMRDELEMRPTPTEQLESV